MLAQSQRSESDALLRKVVPAGEFWFAPVARGQALRLVDLEGNEAVDTLFYSAEDTAERYSAVDTVREQGNVYLSTGSVLLSTRGNPMLEIVADTCGRHDTLAGACAGESNTVRYAHDRKCMHSCRDNWMNAIARHPAFGVTKRDVTHNINFFMNVPISEQARVERFLFSLPLMRQTSSFFYLVAGTMCETPKPRH